MKTQTTHVLKDFESGKNAIVKVVEKKDKIGYLYNISIKGTNIISNKVTIYYHWNFIKQNPKKVAEDYFKKWLKKK